MQLALQHPIQWTFFINVSGADYPLVSPLNQRRLLTLHDFTARNRSFFSFSDPAWWDRSKSFRYDRLFTDTSLAFNDSDAQMVDSYAPQPLTHILNFTFVAAEAWMILHRSLVSHFLVSPTARRMLLSFAFSLEPEEHFFPAVAYNDPDFNHSTVPHALRHVIWTHDGKHSGQHPYYVDKLNRDDGSWTFRNSIVNSGCFFTRKLRLPDSPLLDWLDAHVSGVSNDTSATDDVDKFLTRVKRLLACIAIAKVGDRVDSCFPDWTD